MKQRNPALTRNWSKSLRPEVMRHICIRVPHGRNTGDAQCRPDGDRNGPTCERADQTPHRGAGAGLMDPGSDLASSPVTSPMIAPVNAPDRAADKVPTTGTGIVRTIAPTMPPIRAPIMPRRLAPPDFAPAAPAANSMISPTTARTTQPSRSQSPNVLNVSP